MFVGTHERLLDGKGRLVLPPPFRRHLVDACYLTSGSGPCVRIYTEGEIHEVADRLERAVRDGLETPQGKLLWAASITEARTDSQGRLAIPPAMREAAGLDREVVLLGAINHGEIWSPANFAALQTQFAGNEGNEAVWS